ncbi:MAG: mfd [Rickettsiaceae bacterium]|jgi:transcription-repair coupling factor (superfamily II helicase)|nr:mfd [Rickettsiaceae bacterium]
MDYKVKLQKISHSTSFENFTNDSAGFVLQKLIKNSPRKHFLHITADDKDVDLIQKQIQFFAPNEIQNNELQILSFPAWDCLPFDRVSPKSSIISARINTLRELCKNDSGKKTLVIASIGAVLQKTIPSSLIKNSGFKIETGEEISIDSLAQTLIDNGFSRVPTASSISEFAIRGNIVDIIAPYNNSWQNADDLIGYRLDFFGDAVETIRVFDPLTQITNNKINKINLFPATEINLNQKSIGLFKNNYRSFFGIPQEDMMYNAISEGRSYAGMEHFLPLFYDQPLSNIFSYLSEPQISLSEEVLQLKNEKLKIIEEYYQTRVATLQESKKSGSIYNPLPPQYLYLNDEEFKNETSKTLEIKFLNQGQNSETNIRKIDLEIKPIPDFALASRANKTNVFELFKDFLKIEFNEHKIILACFSLGSQERLKKILFDHDVSSKEIENSDDISKLAKNQIGLCVLPIGNGFFTSDLMIIGEAALLGEKTNRQTSKKSAERILSEGITLQVGELVVHRYHGIGKFDGLHHIETSGITNDFLKILYFGSDVLFVPVEDINLITRYGSDNALITLDRLGNNSWKNRREKVRARIKIAAEQLIKIAAERQIKKAPILIPKQMEYEEFKARFGFSETTDQLRAISEIEEDLQKGSPMDRLVCGDVGFGKTEVAMRAAFIAAQNEKEPYQVAIVTPTTLLCRQHYHNFINRFRDTDLKIAQLSRMVSTAEANKIKKDLEEGKIDLIIGTHALLNKNIKFKKLGLLIVDEEQHFGVAQKERIKELKSEVHILTLSATPIPRTLQMSLTGVKELSIISTPPVDRLAIRNYVMPYDSVIIREAVLREYQRGGKSFFVVPRIQDIDQLYDKLCKQIPEVKIEVAHGQMPPGTLDKIMNDFYDGKFDVLVSTTIIESGIDISSANTMIIYKAEHFGLAQLYQLRGRVGRGKIRGYCYFTTKVNKLSEIAKKKLQVMQTLDALGAGFSIASHDMDIRGSGNILGDEQSGHIRETGAELYQSMLVDAIKALKSGAPQIDTKEVVEEEFPVQIKLGISLLIPENYMSDLSTRMQFYKRIATIENQEQQEQISVEIIDRFGKLPVEIENLLQIAYLKSLCKKINIEKVEANSQGILITFRNNHFDNGEKLLEMVFSSKNQIKLQGHKILFLAGFKSDQEKLQNALNAINKINSLVK